MKKTFRISLILLLLLAVALLGFACSASEVDYSKIESISVDNESIVEGFLLSEFDISMVKLNVIYKSTLDANGKVVAGETIKISAKENMIKAEDKAKLSVPGANNITLIYGKFTIEFILKLYDDAVLKYKVTFLNEDGSILGDTQYIVAGGKAVIPNLPTKSGFVFIGWKDRETNKYSTLDNIQKNTTVTATYAPSTYEVAYYTKIGDVEKELIKINVPRGANAYDYAPEIPIISGFSNGRWEDTTLMTGVDSIGLKFYAIYDRDQIQISYIYKRSSAADTEFKITTAVNQEIKNPPDAERAGYKFIGWYANDKKVIFPYTVTNEMTFVAKYIDINTGNSGLSYTPTANGYAVSGYDGKEEIVVIPRTAKVGGVTKEVVEINEGIFKNYNIKEYVVSEDNDKFKTVDNVLYNFAKTKILAYPNAKTNNSYSVATETKEIGNYAFYNAKNLFAITLNDSVTSIGENAFAECANLISFNINKAVLTIGKGAFKILNGISALANITFDASSVLTTINDEAFYGLDNLKTIILPSTLTTLGENVFYNCKNLSSITAPNNNKFVVLEGALYSSGATKLYAYPALYDNGINSEFTVDSRCTEIKPGAFTSAKLGGLKITSIVNIMGEAISCPNLMSIRILANNVSYTLRSFGDYVPTIYVVSSNAKLSSLQIDFTTNVKVYVEQEWANAENFYSDYIYKKEKVTTNVGGSQLQTTEITILGCRKTTANLNIPNIIDTYKVTKIAANAFNGDNTIINVTLPVDLVEIGYRAFYNAKNLHTIIVNDLLKTVGNEAFSGCSNLEEFVFTENLEITSFGVAVMDGTAWLDESVEMLSLGNVLVKFNGLGISVSVPSKISYIATDAFSYKSNLTTINFVGENLKIIDYRAFQFCSGIASIIFPRSIKHIKNQAFYGCTYLYTVTYSDIPSTDNKLTVEAEAFDTSNPVYQIYSDTTLYELTYYIDNADTIRIVGKAFVVPYRVENTGTSRFAGWYEDNEYVTNAKFPMSITSNTTLYAKWIGITSSTSGLQFELNESGQYKVVGYVGTDPYVIVPDKYKDKNVTEIGAGAFLNKSYVTKIELPNTLVPATGEFKSKIQNIGENAFSGTSWYDNYQGDFVIIDDILVKYKGSSTEVQIPANITKIAEGAFKNNHYLEKIILSEALVLLDNSIFEDCINLKTVVLPKTLLQINNKVFYNCTSLVDIDFSRCINLANIGYDAFDNTLWIKNYIDDCILINKTLFKYQGKASKLHIINGIDSISENAFKDNNTLTTIYIPESVKFIGQSAFENCTITEVSLFAGGNKLENISRRAFYDCTFLTTLNLSLANNLKYIGESAFQGCTNYKTLIIPNSLESLGEYSFYETGLNTIFFVLGSKLNTISNYAFAENRSLTSVVFNGSNSLKVIGEYAFENCISLRTFKNSGSSIEKISEGAFKQCSALASFAIDESKLNEIGNDALDGVGVLNNDSNMVVLGNILISYNGKDKEVTIPSSITSIYNRAFYGNALITTVKFETGSNIKSINSEAFAGCVNLDKIIFPSSIVYVGDDVMLGTKWYQDNRNEQFIIIGSTLIKYNSSITKQAIIPDNISVINANAFAGTSVFDITIGTSVTKIANGAFDGILNTYSNWTITMLGENPPQLLEMDTLDAFKVLLNSLDTMESYRLDAGWAQQYNAGKLFAKPTFEIAFNIPTNTATPIENKNLYAIYSEINVNTYVTENLAYVFTGWYFDAEFSQALTYPYIFTSDITLYAKCIDNTVGSNAAYFEMTGDETNKTIVRYQYFNDTKLVVISSHASVDILAIGQSYQPSPTGEYIYVGGEYIIDPVSTGERYAYLGAFENHSELIEVYFAVGSKLTTIGNNAFANCTKLRKIVIPSTIKTIKSGAFKNCTSLMEIVFAGDVSGVTIESGAFENCSALSTFTLPDGVISIGDGAFANCNNLKDIYVTAIVPINLGEIEPFEKVVGLIIHIPHGKYNVYATSWPAYESYLQENN